MHLCFIGNAIDGDEFAANLYFFELGSEVGNINEESLLIKTSEQGLKCKFRVRIASFVLLEEVEERFGPEIVAFEVLMQGITQ